MSLFYLNFLISMPNAPFWFVTTCTIVLSLLMVNSRHSLYVFSFHSESLGETHANKLYKCQRAVKNPENQASKSKIRASNKNKAIPGLIEKIRAIRAKLKKSGCPDLPEQCGNQGAGISWTEHLFKNCAGRRCFSWPFTVYFTLSSGFISITENNFKLAKKAYFDRTNLMY